MDVYSPPTDKRIVYLFPLSLTDRVCSESPRRRWNLLSLGDNDVLCCFLLQRTLQLTLCVCVCSLQPDFGICPPSIVFSEYRPALKESSFSFPPPSPSIYHSSVLSFWPLASVWLVLQVCLCFSWHLHQPQRINRCIAPKGSASFTKATAKCIKKVLVSQMFHAAALSSWFSFVFVSLSLLSDINLSMLNQREKVTDKSVALSPRKACSLQYLHSTNICNWNNMFTCHGFLLSSVQPFEHFL